MADIAQIVKHEGDKRFIHPIKKIFPKYYPIANENSKILILGSFPSKDWVNGGFYYGSLRNSFWKLIVRIFDKQFSDLSSFCYCQIGKGSKIDDYVKTMEPDNKAELLLNNNIALWDIIDECNSNTGDWPSEDDKITQQIPNDILSFLDKHKKIQKVLFTGRTSLKKKIAKKIESEYPRKIEVDYLPSPTIRVISRGKYIEKWRELL